jgi:iron-sulfur cluster repair protein YtfE (RIC family)
MTTLPNLLNDDGSASIATALMTSHHGFRRDLAQFAAALRRVGAADRSRVDALREEWAHFRGKLHGHHEAEDSNLFPHLRSQQPSLATIIEGLEADHRRVDPLLEQGDRAFANLPAMLAAASDAVTRLRTLLAPHLASEEAHLFPCLREAKQFPAAASEAELAQFAEGFAWSTHGIAPDIVARLNEILPPALVERLPAARAAFRKRCERVWGTSEAGASRTPVPDWIE